MSDVISYRIEKIESLLKDCVSGTPIMISDGTASNTFGMIEFIPTAGGMQYGLRRVTMTGTGSGLYFQIGQEEDLVVAALQMIERVEQPHPFTQKLIAEGRMKKPEPLSFYLLDESNMPLPLRRTRS